MKIGYVNKAYQFYRGFVLSRSGANGGVWWDDGGSWKWKKVRKGVVEKKRETERFMSDMVIFISRGKKARFHAVGAFIPFSDDKGTERENGECGGREGEREREKEIRRHAKTLKLWTRFSKEPYIRGNANNRDSRPYVEASCLRASRTDFFSLIFYLKYSIVYSIQRSYL